VGTAGTTETTPKTGISNALGLYDMSGNVSEWCFDWASSYYSTRVIRGGYWHESSPDCAQYLQVGYASRATPNFKSNFIGFRPVRTN